MGGEKYLPEGRFSLSRDGGELVYYRYGPPPSDEKSVCLAIHGITSSNRAWQLFARNMVEERGYSLYAVDLRGRGDSNGIVGPFGMRVHAEDMVAVLDHAGLNKVMLVGHSMGAFVVSAMLAIAPKRVLRAVLVDGGIPLALPPGHTVETLMPLILGPALTRLAMKFDSQEAYREYFRPQKAFIKGWSAALCEYADYDLRGQSPSTLPGAVEADSRDLFEDSGIVVQGLESFQNEILLLRAERGLQDEPIPLYPKQIIDNALQKYPRIKLVTLDSNHYDILLDDGGASTCVKTIFGEV